MNGFQTVSGYVYVNKHLYEQVFFQLRYFDTEMILNHILMMKLPSTILPPSIYY